jgi:hypothetical protein
MEQSHDDPLLPVRLPGYYSVRGDWFLAVAKGSRSPRLGMRALDLLSSQRANARRLELGLGLPVRPISATNRPNDDMSPTAISIFRRDGRKFLTYCELKKLLAAPDDGFYWIFRSKLRSYSKHSRVWGKWLSYLLSHWSSWRREDRASPHDGFGLYQEMMDEPSREPLSDYRHLASKPPSIHEFAQSARFVTSQLILADDPRALEDNA